jgi:VIT1/CCC1 family predicted Fe2+/Mn2+ transporter
MSEPRVHSRAEASSIAWNWRDRATGEGTARAREAAANRRKGLIGAVIGLAVAAAVYFFFHRPVAAAVIAIIAVVIALLALASPLGLYKGLSRLLDRFAHAVGSVVTWVLMTVLFYVVFLPVGAILRARGRLGISRNADRRLPTYWTSTEERERARTPESYRKQF